MNNNTPSPASILVVGGAGYIGSHMVRYLQDQGRDVIVLDDFSTGQRQAIGSATFIEGNLGDSALLDTIFTNHNIDTVMHFAAYIQVGESVEHPAKYYDNNVVRTITLLDKMVEHKIPHFIFSSTAAVFGNPDYTPIDEKHPHNPINPYGKTKLMVEGVLADYARAYGLKFGCLRYFNAAGAHPDGSIGPCHQPVTHLIPLIMQAASGRRKSISVFGTDYETSDGSCIRDYIHVQDLCDAHVKLLDYMQQGGEEHYFNLGTGRGYSVLEVINETEAIIGLPVPKVLSERRPGDPAILIADGSKARSTLQWQPTMSDLSTIITHAWAWEQKLLTGHPFN